MFVVAVDVGYSNLKVLAGTAGHDPAATILPAGAGPSSTMPEQLGRARDDGHVVVSVDGEAWAAGVEPSRLQNWERELHPDYPATPAYRALCHAAMVVAGSARIDRLVTGLPVAQYQGTARRERLRAMLTGTHQVTPQRQVEVAAVDILPQPAGAYLDMTRDATAAEAFEEARTLVIDPGFFSVDWVLIDGGELRSANSGSTTNAMSLLIEAADDLIQQEHGARLGRDQIEKAIRLGSARVKLFGEPIELAPYIAAAAKRTTAVALAAVRQSMRGERREVDVILLAGGGAAVYADATRDAFPKARVVVPEAPVLANVRGFWTHAAPTDAVTENAATDVDDGVAAPPKVASKRPVATPARRGAPLRGVTGRGAKPRGDC